jgi:hypothetical protein
MIDSRRKTLRLRARALVCVVAMIAAATVSRPALAQDKSAPKPPAKADATAKPAAPKATEPQSPMSASVTGKDRSAAKDDKVPATASADSTQTKPTGNNDEEAETTEIAPPPSSNRNPNDPFEDSRTNYRFVGVRYRGTIVPKAILNIFVNEGATIYSNSVGIEFEQRHDGFSIIPALTFSEYGQGDTLFLEKGKPDSVIGNWSMINSQMKALYLSVDFLWSKKISRTLDFEYGFGAGLGALFGPLVINWVYDDPNGVYTSDNGRRFSACQNGDMKSGCLANDHSNSKEIKTGRYEEPSWFGGGAKPVLFPTITIPNIGLRYKPVRSFAARAQIGFSITGFWFGISGSYGFEGKKRTAPVKSPEAVEVEETVE